MRTKPYKYNPETLRRLVDDGLTNAEIAREMEVAQSVVNKRLNDIRKIKQVEEIESSGDGEPVEIDLTLYDTVRRQGDRAIVLAITSDLILLKKVDLERYQTAEAQVKLYIQISRGDYAAGRSGWKRVPFERVTVTNL